MRVQDSGLAFSESCASCNAILNGDDWYPVVTGQASDGVTVLYSFCDDTCLAAWDAPD